MVLHDPQLPPDASEESIQGEIQWCKILLDNLDQDSPMYFSDRSHYERAIFDLEAMIRGEHAPFQDGGDIPQLDGQWDNVELHNVAAAPSPNSAESPAGSGGSDSSRKRSLASVSDVESTHPKRPAAAMPTLSAPSNLAHRPNPRSSASMGALQQSNDFSFPMGRISGQNSGIIDLTGDDDDSFSYPPLQTGTLAEPFPEMHNAYSDNEPRPATAFTSNYMSEQDLATFLMTPTPPPGSHLALNAQPMAGGARLGLPSIYSQFTGLGGSQHHMPWQRLEHFAPDFDFDLDYNMPPDGATSDALERLIEGLQPDEEVAKELREQTPRQMCSKLMEHQKLGLTWLKKSEQGSNKGGILADDMGLGKTVQALALVVARPSDDPACKTTLIIAPVALMRQWEKEAQRHIHPAHHLSVFVYHGSGKKATFAKLRTFDVVLTTYGTLTSEFKQQESRNEATRNKVSLLAPSSKWYRVILDEAQCIKNKNTIASKASNELRAKYRLCMTGTPMMNSIDELYPLIRFLQIKPYNDDARFRSHISKPIKTERDRETGLQRVQVLLKTFMLRREKTTKIDGEEICKIPPKQTHVDSVEFSDSERDLYKAIETRSQLKFNRYLEKGTVTNNYANILVLLLRLRQACCHPHLIKDLGVQVSTEGIPEQDLLGRAKQLEGDVVKRLKEMENFECPICFDGVPNPTIFLPCGHTCCGECFQKIIDPANGIREGNENSGAKCPHCRGRLSSDKITDYRHFCKVFAPEKLHVFGFVEDEDEGQEAGTDSDSDEEEQDDDDKENSEEEDDDLDGFIVPDDAEDDHEAPAGNSAIAIVKKEKKKKHKGKNKKKGKGKGPAQPKKTLAQLKQESLRNQAAKLKYLKRLRKTYTTSAKVDETVKLIAEIRNNDPTEKTLIFSQFTTLLDLLEIPLQDNGFNYQRYDGSMKMDDRADAVNKFMDECDQQIMLISLKAGNAGLNLNKASQVIILDPFWNPYVEDQAIDRAHRMPQNREVHVHRLLVPETVEDRIVDLQEKKRELINAALDEKAGQSVSRLSIGDLKYLFGVGSRPT